MSAADWHDKTALQLGDLIGRGEIDPRELTEHYFSRINAHEERDQIYMALTRPRAEREAEAAAARAREGKRLSPLDGVPISWKDLFDSAGDPTEGGSRLLKGRVPQKDAEALARATKAGLICLGKTSLTEFAFSGLGYNPTCGSPANPHDPVMARVPGGSSGGAAVSVAEGLAAAAIGTDTGGSVRIPAAWNGLVGLKTTFGAVPLEGVLPLSPTLDTVGPLTRDVADAAALFAVLSGREAFALQTKPHAGLRLALAKNEVIWNTVDEASWPVFDAALEHLRDAGLALPPIDIPEIDAFAQVWTAPFNPVSWEAYQAWGDKIEAHPELCFKEVRERIMPGKAGTRADFDLAWDYLRSLRKSYLENTLEIDAVVMPTVGFIPPLIEEISESSDIYRRTNGRALFNTAIGNQLGLCALSLPIGRTARTGAHGAMPVGLMLMAKPGDEERLLNIGLTLQELFKDLNA
ncbi:MAG: amidase [Alphaproteobacteria bacterium]|nr:MAG: amidase [Alphaproteobacteria bacterium]